MIQFLSGVVPLVEMAGFTPSLLQLLKVQVKKEIRKMYGNYEERVTSVNKVNGQAVKHFYERRVMFAILIPAWNSSQKSQSMTAKKKRKYR